VAGLPFRVARTGVDLCEPQAIYKPAFAAAVSTGGKVPLMSVPALLGGR